MLDEFSELNKEDILLTIFLKRNEPILLSSLVQPRGESHGLKRGVNFLKEHVSFIPLSVDKGHQVLNKQCWNLTNDDDAIYSTSSAVLDKYESPILFLEIDIISCPQIEKSVIPSLWPLKRASSEGEFLHKLGIISLTMQTYCREPFLWSEQRIYLALA